MVRLRTVKVAAAVSIIIPATALFIWGGALWTPILFIVWIASAAALWISLEKKEQSIQLERSIHALQQTAIHTLNHHRHDWMNDLQVLYGYIRMNKPDKIIQYVEKIRERMVMESRISKLGIPSLVLFFHSFRTGSQTLQLEVVVNGELNLSELPLQADKVSDTLIGLINAYRFGIKPKWGDAPKLIVTINADERALSVDFEFQGELNASEELYRRFKEKLAGSPLQPISMDPLMTRVELQAELRRLNGGTSCL